MAPIRRYLRISKYSVLECRIYLDNPADAYRWLLHDRTPVLPRVIAAVRPLVLPKLREENARAAKGGGKGAGGGGGGKKKGWKDTVVEDDFEVSVFLTETSSRHSILKKEKRVKGEREERLGTEMGNGKMIAAAAGTEDEPVNVGGGDDEDEGGGQDARSLRREDSGEDVRMADIPAARSLDEDDSASDDDEAAQRASRNKKQRPRNGKSADDDSPQMEKEADDKKKMSLETTYDGFSIYGRILCLVVKRKGGPRARGGGDAGASGGSSGTGQAMMEEWIASTQAGEGMMMDD